MATQQFTATLATGVPIPGPAGPPGPPGPDAGLKGIGRIGKDGTVYGSTWTCDHPQTGEYVVTHNLNYDPTTYLVLVCSANDPGTLTKAPPETSLILHMAQQDWNSFTIKAVQGSSLTALDASFNFGVFLYAP